MWQKCPICNGTGKDPVYNGRYCEVCRGRRIINEITGLPPKYDSPSKILIEGLFNKYPAMTNTGIKDHDLNNNFTSK